MLNSIRTACQVAFLAIALTACNTYDPEFNEPLTPERISFSASRLYPEGITYAPTLSQFMVSSIKQGKVGTVDEKGLYADFWSGRQLISGIGMKVRDGRLYVCNGDQGVSSKSTPETALKTAGLVVLDLATHKLVKSVRLDSLLPGVKHFANDIAFDDVGNAYITDSFAPVIYRVTPDFTPTIFVTSPLFAGTEGFNLNGIVYHPDGYLIVVKANEGKLFKINLETPGLPQEITGVNLPNGDGMLLYNNDLYVVNGRNKVTQIRSTDDWKSAGIVKIDSVGYNQATTNVLVDNKIYTINARIGEVNAAVMANNPDLLQASDYSIQQFK